MLVTRCHSGSASMFPSVTPKGYASSSAKGSVVKRGHLTSSVFDVVDGAAPLDRPKREDRAVRVLAVPDKHSFGAGLGGHLDALAAVAPAVARDPPALAGHVVHRCSATLLIRSREAPRGSASDRSRSNACAALLTSAGLSIVMPSTAVSA